MKRHQSKAEMEAPEHQLFNALIAIKTIHEAKQFFQDLCTPAERQALADRWRVVAPIKEGTPYRTIYEQTGVSVTTIGRVARSLLHGTGGYNLIYDRLQRKQDAKKRKTHASQPEKS